LLDSISKRPQEEQLMLANIIRKRITEQRRKEIADSVKDSVVEYHSGITKSGNIDELLNDLDEK
jgi:hypothetical protein